MRRAIGIDFGTTNSAVALATAGSGATLASFATGETPGGSAHVFRSLLYFSPDLHGPDRRPRGVAGPHAIRAYLEADGRGRLIQSMKSHLASRLFTDTNLFGTFFTLEDLIAIIIGALKEAAEAQFGALDGGVVVGRPAHFSGAASDADDEFALSRLRAAFVQVGLEPVTFEYEPVAAAYQYEQQLDHDEVVLIADFGGGTSDFSLLRLGPAARRSGQRHRDILGVDGLPLAGDAFDAGIVRHAVAPRLGLGSSYRSAFDRLLPVPLWLYEKLERWEHLSFLKTPQTMETLRRLRFGAQEPDKLEALIHVVRDDLGYQLSRAVERTKRELSAQESSACVFADGPLALDVAVARRDFQGWIAPHTARLAACVDRLLVRCNVQPADVDSVFLTGGSAFVPAVRQLFATRFGAERLRGGEELTTVARGLALRALQD